MHITRELRLFLLAAICVVPGLSMAAGGDAPITGRLQKDVAPLERNLQRPIASDLLPANEAAQLGKICVFPEGRETALCDCEPRRT